MTKQIVTLLVTIDNHNAAKLVYTPYSYRVLRCTDGCRTGTLTHSVPITVTARPKR